MPKTLLVNSPDPPKVTRSHSPKKMKTKKKTNAPKNEIYKECHNNFSALFKSFAPKLLDIDEETAPPSAPKAICCVSIIAGNANVIAANGMMPSWPINQNSANTQMHLLKMLPY